MVKIEFGASMPTRERVRIWRVVRNLTQRELAARAGMHHGDLARVELGKLTLWPKWLKAVAAALDVPETDLIPPDLRPIPQEDEMELVRRWKPSMKGLRI